MTSCLLHGTRHVMEPDCWTVTIDWYFLHGEGPMSERRAAYLEAVYAKAAETPTFWNGEPTPARMVRMIVGDSPHPVAWSKEFVGMERHAVEVTYGDQVFYLDNEDGQGWFKVTEGHGSLRWGHKSLYGTVLEAAPSSGPGPSSQISEASADE